MVDGVTTCCWYGGVGSVDIVESESGGGDDDDDCGDNESTWLSSLTDVDERDVSCC